MKITVRIVLVLALLGVGWYVLRTDYLPDRVSVYAGERWSFSNGLLTVEEKSAQVTAASADSSGAKTGTLCLFGILPLKTVQLSTVQHTWVIPCGKTFGIKMFTAGVVVADTADVWTLGGAVCPAEEAGIRPGDVILSVDGMQVGTNEDLQSIVGASEGKALKVEYVRDGASMTAVLLPANAKNGTGFKAGMWVRDSSAGIGTVTYINPESGMAAGLGHGVTDSGTGIVLPVLSGELVSVQITGLNRAQAGAPGELKGIFSGGEPFASLLLNCENGVYGKLRRDDFCDGSALPCALRQEVKTGAAKVLCTVDGDGPRYYDVEIVSVNLSDSAPTKNMVVRVTDRALIEKTGGIVQGMSGSPLVQNGKVIGALTHVFVNEPTKGYAVFIENMLESERSALELSAA